MARRIRCCRSLPLPALQLFGRRRVMLNFRTLRVITWFGLAFLYVPLALVVINAFNRSRTFAFPPTGLTLKWWHTAANSNFFGRSTISFLVILPIALPGIVTGIALNAAFRTVLDPLGNRLRLDHGDHRACHVLHRGRLQQRASPAAAIERFAGRGVGRSRRVALTAARRRRWIRPHLI